MTGTIGTLRKAFWQCERGVAAVEFALLMPVLVIILMGIIDYGTFINQKMKLQDLSRTVVQYVVQGGADANITTNIIETSDFYGASQAESQAVIVETDSSCECANGASVVCTDACPTPGDYVRHYYSATLTSTYEPIFVYPGLPDSITLQGYSRMQYNP